MTLDLVGTKQKKMKVNSPKHTNCYFVPAAMKGGLGLKAMMFTHDPAFDPHGRRVEEADSWLEEYGIDGDSVVYIKSNKLHCAESLDNVSHYLMVNRRKMLAVTFSTMQEMQ